MDKQKDRQTGVITISLRLYKKHGDNKAKYFMCQQMIHKFTINIHSCLVSKADTYLKMLSAANY